jgi:hypothetical protein
MATTYDVPDVPLIRPGVPVATFRYAPGVGYQPLSRVKVIEIAMREGANPSSAVFQYISSNLDPSVNAISFEHVLPLVRIKNPDVLDVDDRIVVAGLTPTGTLRFLFDGFMQVPETKFDPKSGETLSFSAQGVEYRCWDDVISGQIVRDAGDPTNPDKSVFTKLPVRFNPRVTALGPGQAPNMTQYGWESVTSDGRNYAIFIDPLAGKKTVKVKGNDTPIAVLWDLFNAVNHLMTVGTIGSTYIKIQDYKYLKKILSLNVPKEGQFYDPDDTSTFDVKPIFIPDTDVEDMPWPDAVEKLCEANGYGMCFRVGESTSAKSGMTWPVTWLDIYKLNDPARTRYKDLYLQKYNDLIDPGASNLGSAQFAHDTSDIVNMVSVSTSPVRYEASFVLAPLFEPSAADTGSTDAKAQFNTKHPGYKNVRNKYRLFGFDEAGEGHWTSTDGFINWTKATDIASLDGLFGTGKDGYKLYAQRRRPPFNLLWTKDVLGEYLRAELYVSTDYKGACPSLWDGSGTWHKANGGFELCDDQLGIRITEQDPNAWNIDKMLKGAPNQLGAGLVRIMEWMAGTNTNQRKPFYLMLVCVIESDQNIDAEAFRRDVSPTKFVIRRTVDQRSRLRPGLIHPSSYHHPDRGKADAKAIDTGKEKDQAKDFATGKRESRQLGAWAGRGSIPRLTNAYIIGDRIRRVAGRDVSLQTNVDANGKEAPVYPRVIGITYKLSEKQETQLILTDKRVDYVGNL